jgi:hypothetical protein
MSTLLSPAIDFKHLLSTSPVDLLSHVHQNRGLIWEEINTFHNQILEVEGSLLHHTEEMQENMPVTHHLDNGLYTREIFMPKGSLVVSFIMTEIGTQRVAYMHEDCTWVCVLRTDANTIEEAEEELFTLNFRELPEHIILKKLL